MVVKLGTGIVMGDDGQLARERLESLMAQCAHLMRQGIQTLVVSSGAVGLGVQALGLPRPPSGKRPLVDKQAAAAVGQSALMEAYRDIFAREGLLTAQILVTEANFADRQQYLNLHGTLERLLELGVIPILNENDTVATAELEEDTQSRGFGDNDKLSALVASRLNADLLMILTNVAGVYTENPSENPDARLIPVIDNLETLRAIRTRGLSSQGRGGMATKLEAARMAAVSGVNAVIANGLKAGIIEAVLQYPWHSATHDPQHLPGTLTLAHASLAGKKRWIGMASGYNGVLTLNARAAEALRSQGASLLAIGVVAAQGDFSRGQVVSLKGPDGVELGRGVCQYDADDVRRILGRKRKEILALLGDTAPAKAEIMIHRDNLVVFSA